MTRTAKDQWRKPMQLTANGGRAEAWAYVSKSGKTMEVFIARIDKDGSRHPAISARVSLPRVKRWVGQ